MTAGSNEEQGAKKAIGAELIIPGCAVAFTLYYFTTILDAPWTAQATSALIGVILIALCLVLFVIRARWLIRGEATISAKILIEPLDALPMRLGLFGLTLGYIILLPLIGFTLTTFAFLSLAMLLLSHGKGVRFKVIMSAVLSVSWFLLFVVAFERRFPLGWFDESIMVLLQSMGVS
ncbi:MAG: hypothetical protein O2912_02955 [Proteobacteria bacterium]|nr:hypothetical protein [Pseudomonadota bacterium]